jgi:hypothetical protein
VNSDNGKLAPAGTNDKFTDIAPEEIDARVAAQPWILRPRLTWEAYATRERAAGREPDMVAWMEDRELSDEELDELKALREADRVVSGADFSNYFVIREYFDKPRVCRQHGDHLVAMTFEDFRNAHIDKVVEIEVVDAKGNLRTKLVNAADHWLKHHARFYQRAEFLPGKIAPDDTYNLWGGWPAGLKPGWEDFRLGINGREPVTNGPFDGEEMPTGYCDLFIDHMLYAMCDGDEELFRYLAGWMADALWNPGPRDVAIVLQGVGGTGKTFWAERFMEFFAPHWMTLDDSEDVLGKFNAHLTTLSVAFADEAFFAGNPKHAAKLKSFISSGTLNAQAKFANIVRTKKQFRVIMASNDAHVVRAAFNERRFLALRVDSGANNKNRAHFRAMQDEWDSGGKAALFRWLTGKWWGDQVGNNAFGLWDVPETDLLREQKVMSLAPGDSFILSILEEGQVGAEKPARRQRKPGAFLGNGRAPQPHGLFQIMRERVPKLRGESEKALAQVLADWGARRTVSNGERFWVLPSLGEMRAAFVAKYGPRDWGDDEVFWADDRDDYAEPEPF